MINFFHITKPQRGGGDDRKKQRKWEAARLIAKKRGLGMCSVFGSRKSPHKCCPEPGNGEKNGRRKGKSLKLFRGKIKHSSHHGHSANVRITRVKEEGLGNLPNVLRRIKAPASDGEIEAAAAKDDSEGDARLAKRILMEGKGRLLSLPGIFVCPDIKREEEDIEDAEPCKKRILMGEKCRPLNSSGILH